MSDWNTSILHVNLFLYPYRRRGKDGWFRTRGNQVLVAMQLGLLAAREML